MILSLDVNFWFLTAYKSYVYTVDRNNQEAIYNRGRKEVNWRQLETLTWETQIQEALELCSTGL